MGDEEDAREIEELKADLAALDAEHRERRAAIVDAIRRVQARIRVRRARSKP